jgi:prepilin-type N-terminal cleavage/methylation domain-containing protein
MRRGITILEMLTVLAILGIVLLVTTPRVVGWRDSLLTQRAARELAMFYSRARLGAVFRARRVRIEFSQDSLWAVFEGPSDSAFLRHPGPGRHGVSLAASRRVIRLAPTGIGWGPANTKLVLRRGAAAESLTTSRLGRLKLWP